MRDPSALGGFVGKTPASGWGRVGTVWYRGHNNNLYYIGGVPYYDYSIMGPKTLFPL